MSTLITEASGSGCADCDDTGHVCADDGAVIDGHLVLPGHHRDAPHPWAGLSSRSDACDHGGGRPCPACSPDPSSSDGSLTTGTAPEPGPRPPWWDLYWPPAALRAGVTRRVLLLGPWALKVPRIAKHGSGARGRLWSLSRGVQANLSEVEWSGSVGLAPLRRVWLAGLLLVAERAAPMTATDVEGWDWPEYQAATGFIAPVDKKPEDLGRLRDGHIVFVDADMSWNDHPPFCCARHQTPPDDDDEPAGVVGRDVPMDDVARCCEMNCSAVAEWNITAVRPDGTRAFLEPGGDDTQACTAHVGELLGPSCYVTDPDNVHYEVRTLADAGVV